MSKRNVGRGLNAVSDGRNPKRPGSRLRKNTPVIGRAAQIAEHAAVVKRRQELAAAAAHRRAEARAEWAAELEQLRKVENRRIKRIERDGISVNDIALVCGLAQDMLGGIGPKGIAMRFAKVIPTISRELRALLHLAERAKAHAAACRKERARKDRRGGRIHPGAAPARRGRRR